MADSQKMDLNAKQGPGTAGPTAIGHGPKNKGRLAGITTGENIKEKQVGVNILFN